MFHRLGMMLAVSCLLIPKLPAASPSHLLVESDVGGDLWIDGARVAEVARDQPVRIPVEPGGHIVTLTTELTDVSWEEDVSVRPGHQKLLRVELAARLRSGRRGAAALELERLRHRDLGAWRARMRSEGRLVVELDLETLESIPQGLQWFRWSELSGGSWRQAINHCADAAQGGHLDWRLPTIEELEEFHRLGGRGLLHHRGITSWSATTSRPAEALAFDFSEGERRSIFLLDRESGAGALCVREAP